MKLMHQVAALAVLALALTSCATSGAKIAELRLPSVEATELGRIYVYRVTALGAAIQPTVYLNDVAVGKSTPKGFFYVDRPAGAYTIRTSTEVKRTLSLTLEPGQTRYVRLGVSIGFFVGHVYPELVDNAEGESQIRELHYTGETPPAS